MTPEQRKEVLSREAQRRVQVALDQIEDAQSRLNDAARTLSSLRFAWPECKATGAMADRVRAHWYKVRNSIQLGRKAAKVELDPLATDCFLTGGDA